MHPMSNVDLQAGLPNVEAIYYHGQCREECREHSVSDTSIRDSYNFGHFDCFVFWTGRFGIWDWHWKQAVVPGVWVIPSAGLAVRLRGTAQLAHDTGGFGDSVQRLDHESQFKKKFWPHVSSFPLLQYPSELKYLPTHRLFVREIPNMLIFHSGGGGRHDEL